MIGRFFIAFPVQLMNVVSTFNQLSFKIGNNLRSQQSAFQYFQ